VQALVEHSTQAQRLVRLDEVLDRCRVQHRLHEALRLVQVEERAFLRRSAHLQDAALAVPDGVGARARRHCQQRLLARERGARDVVGERHDLGLRRGIAVCGRATG
jgi:hypothetical protein